MKRIPDNSIDLVLTDPPYGISIGKGGRIGNNNKTKVTKFKAIWDETRVGKYYFDEIFRISKHQIIFGGNYYTDILPISRLWIVWNKLNTGDFGDGEIAWTSFNKPIKIYNYLWNGMIKHSKEKRYHPTQKPVGLFNMILNDFSNKGDVVLDPFIGSGTTAVACINTNRNYIGMEIDETYYKIAQQRIKEAKLQLKLF
jgi:DNA modification methylase